VAGLLSKLPAVRRLRFTCEGVGIQDAVPCGLEALPRPELLTTLAVDGVGQCLPDLAKALSRWAR
jgi:hypothetical protein